MQVHSTIGWQEEVNGLTGAEVDARALGDDDDDFEGFGALRYFEDFEEVEGDDEDITGGDWISMCGGCSNDQDIEMMSDECLTAEFFYYHYS